MLAAGVFLIVLRAAATIAEYSRFEGFLTWDLVHHEAQGVHVDNGHYCEACQPRLWDLGGQIHTPIGCTNGWRCALSIHGSDWDYLSPGPPTRKETDDHLESSRSSVGGQWFLFALALRARGSPNRTHGWIARSANRLCTRWGRASVLPSPKAEAGTPRHSGRCRRSRGPRLGGPKGHGAHSHRGSTRSRRATKLD